MPYLHIFAINVCKSCYLNSEFTLHEAFINASRFATLTSYTGIRNHYVENVENESCSNFTLIKHAIYPLSLRMSFLRWLSYPRTHISKGHWMKYVTMKDLKSYSFHFQIKNIWKVRTKMITLSPEDVAEGSTIVIKGAAYKLEPTSNGPVPGRWRIRCLNKQIFNCISAFFIAFFDTASENGVIPLSVSYLAAADPHTHGANKIEVMSYPWLSGHPKSRYDSRGISQTNEPAPAGVPIEISFKGRSATDSTNYAKASLNWHQFHWI